MSEPSCEECEGTNLTPECMECGLTVFDHTSDCEICDGIPENTGSYRCHDCNEVTFGA